MLLYCHSTTHQHCMHDMTCWCFSFQWNKTPVSGGRCSFGVLVKADTPVVRQDYIKLRLAVSVADFVASQFSNGFCYPSEDTVVVTWGSEAPCYMCHSIVVFIALDPCNVCRGCVTPNTHQRHPRPFFWAVPTLPPTFCLPSLSPSLPLFLFHSSSLPPLSLFLFIALSFYSISIFLCLFLSLSPVSFWLMWDAAISLFNYRSEAGKLKPPTPAHCNRFTTMPHPF